MYRTRLLAIGFLFLLTVVITGTTGAKVDPGGFIPVAAPMVRVFAPASGLFLVSSRNLTDPHFSRTVVYLVVHDDDGSLGLVVNRPSEIRLADAVSGVEGTVGGDHAIYYGGPVRHGMITMLMRNEEENPLLWRVHDGVFFSYDRRVLDRMLDEQKPTDALRFYMGHASWIAGQLQQEIDRGDWFVIEADPDAIFSTRPVSLWTRLIDRLDPGGLYVKTEEVPFS